MIGMVYKDLMVQRKSVLYYLGFIIVYSVLSITGAVPTSTILGLGCMLGFLLPINALAFDEQVKWDSFAAITPNGRKNIVIGKYVFALAATVVGTGGCLATTVLFSLLGLIEDSVLELILVAAACAASATVLNCIILPIMFKFGTQKTRVVMMIVFAAVFGGFGVAALARDKISLPEFPEWAGKFLPLAGIFVCVILLVGSYLISLHIYQKKEF